MSEILTTLAAALRRSEPVGLVTVIEGAVAGAKLLVRPGQPTMGSLGHPELDRVVARDALGELEAGRTGTRRYGAQGQLIAEAGAGKGDDDPDELMVFVESFAPPPQMIIFGAVDFTAALAKVGKILGYRVVVCDARRVFATKQRFPMADDVMVEWPGRVFEALGDSLGSRDVVCILTHDPKFDVPAIQGALASAAGYIGVMGSRNTHARRMERLAEVGVTDPAAIARIHAPIGLDLGARTPEETAVSICAEIIARRTGRAVVSLRDTAGPIH